jgi:hypothetical protein
MTRLPAPTPEAGTVTEVDVPLLVVKAVPMTLTWAIWAKASLGAPG